MREFLTRPMIGSYNEAAEQAAIAVEKANGYRPFIAALPESAQTTVAPLATYQPRVSVPVGSLLWAISGKSAQAAGFKVQITDTATQKPLFSEPVLFDLATGQSTGAALKDCYGNAVDLSSSLHKLPVPMKVLDPGVVTVKVQNLAAVANTLQLALHFSLRTRAADLRPNQWNRLLDAEMARAKRAIRAAGSSSFDTGAAPGAIPGGPMLPSDTDLIPVPFDISTVGNNTIIQGNAAGKICIYHFDFWNSDAQQDITISDGVTNLRGPWANFPAQDGYAVTETEKPHFKLDPGRSFVINISAARLTGLVRYRVE